MPNRLLSILLALAALPVAGRLLFGFAVPGWLVAISAGIVAHYFWLRYTTYKTSTFDQVVWVVLVLGFAFWPFVLGRVYNCTSEEIPILMLYFMLTALGLRFAMPARWLRLRNREFSEYIIPRYISEEESRR